MEFLLFLENREDLGQAVDLLENAGIPYSVRPRDNGDTRRVTGAADGAEIYVDRRYTHRALRLLRRFDPDAQSPFSDAELDAAMDDFYADYGTETEEEDPAEPVSPEGYRMVFVFLGVFAVLVVAALLLR